MTIQEINTQRRINAIFAITNRLLLDRWTTKTKLCQDLADHLNLTGVRTMSGGRNWSWRSVARFCHQHNIDLREYYHEL